MRWLFCVLVLTSCTPTPPPNILLILTDDMGYGDLSMAGNPDLITPHLDKMATQGTTFTDFYVSPVCAPTRASLLTGRYHQRTGVHSVTNGWETIDPEEITLAERLQESGYRTGVFGKWHLGEYAPSTPNGQGFDEFVGFRTGHTADYIDATLEKNGEPYSTQGHISEVLTDEALHFMAVDSAPFFCFLAYNAPHTPLQLDSACFGPYLERGLDERTARVYGMIEQLDEQVGRVMEALDHRDLMDNTIVIFMSDNGPISGWKPSQDDMRYNGGLRDQKFTVYEGGIRTQSFWVWKEHWPSQKSNQVAAHIDLVPTLCDILDLKPPTGMDGISLSNILEGAGSQISRTFFQQLSLETLGTKEPFPGGIAREGKWKMVNGQELYDLETDPGESTNLAVSHPDTLAHLLSLYDDWWTSILDSDDFEINPIPVGLAEENPAYLQPHHAKKVGQVTFTGWKGLVGDRLGTHPTGVDGDWLANWHISSDTISWQIQPSSPGSYEIGLMLRSTHSIDAPIALAVDGDHVTTKVRIEPSRHLHYSFLATSMLSDDPTQVQLNLPYDIPYSIELHSLVVKKL